MSIHPCGVCEQPLTGSVNYHLGGEKHPFHTACVRIFNEILEECPVCNLPKHQMQFHDVVITPLPSVDKDSDLTDPVEVENCIHKTAKKIQEASGMIEALEGFLKATRIPERVRVAKENIKGKTLSEATQKMCEEDIAFLEQAIGLLEKTKNNLSKQRENYQTQADLLGMLHHFNLLNPVQIDRLLAKCDKTIERCQNYRQALVYYESLGLSDRFAAALQNLDAIKGKVTHEDQKNIKADIDFIQMKLSLMTKLKKLYEQQLEKEEKSKSFLEQTKRSPADVRLVLSDSPHSAAILIDPFTP